MLTYCTKIVELAVMLSSLYIPVNSCPNVMVVEQAFFDQHICGGKECDVGAVYAGGQDIYISENLDIERNPADASLLLAMTVHWLQFENGLMEGKMDCTRWAALRFQTQVVQAVFLSHFDVAISPQTNKQLVAECEAEKRETKND